MKKLLVSVLAFCMLSSVAPAFAGTHGINGSVSARSVCAGALSLIVWPGLGQVVNEEAYEKNLTHAILGLTGIFRIWSCYDAVVDRHGGVWENRI